MRAAAAGAASATLGWVYLATGVGALLGPLVANYFQTEGGQQVRWQMNLSAQLVSGFMHVLCMYRHDVKRPALICVQEESRFTFVAVQSAVVPMHARRDAEASCPITQRGHLLRMVAGFGVGVLAYVLLLLALQLETSTPGSSVGLGLLGLAGFARAVSSSLIWVYSTLAVQTEVLGEGAEGNPWGATRKTHKATHNATHTSTHTTPHNAK